MNVWHLVTREIAHRRLTFALAVAAVAAAVGGLVAVTGLVGAHGHETQRALVTLEDDVRQITKGLGYNVLIIHKDQDLGEFYSRGHASKTMPESTVRRLADSDVITVQHLLPSLHWKLEWPEQKFPIILMGTRDEVPLAHRDAMKPIQQAVRPGTAVVGHVLHERLGIAEGRPIALLGKTFTVAKVHPPRGNDDDITVWLDLADAQALLGQEGRVNAILALSCFCAEATPDGIAGEITRVLPEARAIVLGPQEAARRAARARAAEHGETMTREWGAFAAWTVRLGVAGCTVWVGLLALGNVRQRRHEIGILRAIGVRSGQILAMVLGRAILIGLVGAVIGYVGGAAVAMAWAARGAAADGAGGLAPLVRPAMIAAVLMLAPVLSALASVVPAVLAARQDPATVLHEE